MQTNWFTKRSLVKLYQNDKLRRGQIAQCAAEDQELLDEKQAWLLQNMIHLNKENNWTCGVLQVQFFEKVNQYSFPIFWRRKARRVVMVTFFTVLLFYSLL